LYTGATIFSLVGWNIFWRQNSKRSKNDGPELFETYFSWIDSISELPCSNDDIYDVDDIKKKNYENGYYEYIIKT